MSNPNLPELHTETIGSGPHKVAFLHGLMGRGKNFTGIAKALGEDYTMLLVDLPNHANSPWTDTFDYREMADAAASTLKTHFGGEPINLIGHSMGGKTAMYVALRHPELIRRLIIIDIAPAVSNGDFHHLLGSLLKLDISQMKKRSEAQAALKDAIPSNAVRGFLLQNLKMNKDGVGGTWQPNLQMLFDSLEKIMDWEGIDPAQGEKPFDGPVLWIAGENSPYIQPEDTKPMRELFPRVRKITVKGATHWVHADKPEETTYLIDSFLKKD